MKNKSFEGSCRFRFDCSLRNQCANSNDKNEETQYCSMYSIELPNCNKIIPKYENDHVNTLLMAITTLQTCDEIFKSTYKNDFFFQICYH